LTRARFWSDHRNVVLDARQRKVLDKMLEAGPGRFGYRRLGMVPAK